MASTNASSFRGMTVSPRSMIACSSVDGARISVVDSASHPPYFVAPFFDSKYFFDLYSAPATSFEAARISSRVTDRFVRTTTVASGGFGPPGIPICAGMPIPGNDCGLGISNTPIVTLSISAAARPVFFFISAMAIAVMGLSNACFKRGACITSATLR